MEAERIADRERNAVEAKLEALTLTADAHDGAQALLNNSHGISIKGSIASLIEIEKGWESAVSAALGNLADAIVVSDVDSAITALRVLRDQKLGRADVLIHTQSTQAFAVPAGLTSIRTYVRSQTISDLIESLLSRFVVAESADEAADILRRNSEVTVVTRSGDLIAAHRARGGAASSNSLIEIQTLSLDLKKKLSDLTHTCDRLKFEISAAASAVSATQADFDGALAKLNESDARIAALTEQLAVSGQNIKSATSEVERLTTAIDEASTTKSRDENELSIASNQMHHAGEIAEPDYSRANDLRNQVSTLRTAEVEARLAVRTSEERVASLSARAQALEDAAQAERDASERAVSRRGARARGAIIFFSKQETAYEVLIHIERTIAQASAERSRLEINRTEREGETLTVRARNRELTTELEQLTSSVHRDEIARAEQRMRVEALELKAVEELGIDIPTMMSEYGPDKDVPTFIETESGEIVATELIPYRRDQQEKRLASAERSLTLLGKINPLALEEFSALEERLKFLAEQLEDLKRTKKDLLDIIKIGRAHV